MTKEKLTDEKKTKKVTIHMTQHHANVLEILAELDNTSMSVQVHKAIEKALGPDPTAMYVDV